MGLLLVGSPLRPALAADDFQRYLGAAVQLYENLEYERALAQVQRARTVARGVEQDVSLGLHEGIFLAELGRWNEARTAFETALLLEPAAKLPLSVSPKVESQLEAVRQDVNAAITRRMQGANPGTATPATIEVKPPEQEPVAKVKPPEQEPVAEVKPPEQEPVAEVKPPEQEPVAASETRVEQGTVADVEPPAQRSVAASDRPEQAQPDRLMPAEPSPALTPTAEVETSRPLVIPLMLLSTSAVVGGAGVFFSGLSGSSAEKARNEATAGMLYGTAGLTLAGAVVTWLIIRAKTPAELIAEDTAP
jgi:tetratricopeptide (TPR) repeat protein